MNQIFAYRLGEPRNLTMVRYPHLTMVRYPHLTMVYCPTSPW